MLESIQNDEFEYEKLTQEEQAKRGILGRLKGVIADFKKPTRNGRLYSEEGRTIGRDHGKDRKRVP